MGSDVNDRQVNDDRTSGKFTGVKSSRAHSRLAGERGLVVQGQGGEGNGVVDLYLSYDILLSLHVKPITRVDPRGFIQTFQFHPSCVCVCVFMKVHLMHTLKACFSGAVCKACMHY